MAIFTGTHWRPLAGWIQGTTNCPALKKNVQVKK